MWLAAAMDWMTEGVRPLTDKERAEAVETLRTYYGGNWHHGTLWTDELWADCQELGRHLQPAAAGPAFKKLGGPDHALLCTHPNEPGTLHCLTSVLAPAALAARVPATREGVQRWLRELDAPRTRTVRAVLGFHDDVRVPNPYSGELEDGHPHHLDRHFVSSPVVTPTPWGSAFTGPPYSEPAAGIHAVVQARESRKQYPGAIPSFTREGYLSKGRLTYEMHSPRYYVWELSYAPSAFTRDVVEKLNARHTWLLPTDLPTDLLSAVHGFTFITKDEVERRLARPGLDPREASMWVMLLAGLEYDAPDVQQHLRLFFDHADMAVHGAVANAAVFYNWRALLEDLALATPHDELRAWIDDVLSDDLPPHRVSDMGELLEPGVEGDEGDDDE